MFKLYGMDTLGISYHGTTWTDWGDICHSDLTFYVGHFLS